MTLYSLTEDGLAPLDRTGFRAEQLREREDLQRILRDQIEILDDSLLVLSEEFGDWEDSRRRIDLLCLDRDANLVVVELKRTKRGGHMELQALRYAAMIAEMTFEQAVEAHARYLGSRGGRADEGAHDDAELLKLAQEGAVASYGAENVRGVPTQRGLSTPYAASNPAEGIMRIGYAAGGIVANLAIDALESKGFARTLAEPNLVALSGDDASFLAGGEYPVPVYSAEDGNLSVDYRPFGVSLGFTPTVVSADVINLELEAESSAIDTSIVIANNGVQFNGFSTRRAKTTIELKDGESFAIAGLLQDEFVDNANQLPWVGDVPILGTLFRSADFQRRQTELVIIVTAYLISPVTEDAIELPTDRIRLPSEEDLFLLGKLGHAADPVIRSVAGREFEGAYGYVVE